LLNKPADRVISQLIDTVLAKDREFLAWRAKHAESYPPIRVARNSSLPAYSHPPTEHVIEIE
jgi:hypothetical protein